MAGWLLNIKILLFVINDLSEFFFQGSSADQASVDVCLGKQFSDITAVNGTAVLNTDGLCRRFIIDFPDALRGLRRILLQPALL